MELIDKILPLIGVLIGLWLGPYFASRIQNKNAKKTLRAEFVQSIYMFFNYRKARYGSAIRSNYNAALANRVWKNLRNLSLTEIERKENERQYSVLKDIADKAEERQYFYYDRLIEIEGLIIKQLSEIQRHFGVKIYKSVKELIQPHLDESNSLRTPNFLIMSPQEFEEVDYNKVIATFDDELATKCDKLIKIVHDQIPV